MPSVDRTFSHRDVIRIYARHLTSAEQAEVRAYFAQFPVEITPAQNDELWDKINEKFLELIGPVWTGLFAGVEILIRAIDLAGIVNETLGGPTEA